MISAANKFQQRIGRESGSREEDDRDEMRGRKGGSAKYVVINTLGARETNCSLIFNFNSRSFFI